VLTFVGLLLGVLAGWLATGWVSRRTEHSGRLVRSLTREPVIVALLLLLPQPYFGWLNLKDQLADPGVPPGFPFWTLSLTYFYGLVQLGVVLLVFSWLVALIGGSGRTTAVARIAAQTGGHVGVGLFPSHRPTIWRACSTPGRGCFPRRSSVERSVLTTPGGLLSVILRQNDRSASGLRPGDTRGD
jgi:hypothetical protein